MKNNAGMKNEIVCMVINKDNFAFAWFRGLIGNPARIEAPPSSIFKNPVVIIIDIIGWRNIKMLQKINTSSKSRETDDPKASMKIIA